MEREPIVASAPSSEGAEQTAVAAGPSYWRWLALISVLGATLRFWDLDGISIWGDEVFEAREVIRLYQLDFIGSMEGFVGHLVVLLGLLISGADLQGLAPEDFGEFRARGITTTSLRLGPALVGSLTIPVVGAITRGFLGRRQSLVLALLLAVAPWHLYWSQGARFYATQFLFYAIAFVWYFEATERRSLSKLALAMLFFVLAFNAQFTSFVLVPIIAIDWLAGRLADRPPRLDRAAFSTIGTAIACCIAMPLFLYFNVDSYANAHFEQRGNPPWQIGFGIVLFIHPLVVLVAVVTATIRDALPARHRFYLLLGAILPIVIMSAMSFRSFSGSRYGFVSLFPMLALVAVGLVHAYDLLRPRVNRLVAAVPLVLVLGTLLISDVDFYTTNRGLRPRWDSAAALIRPQHVAGEKVAVQLPHLGAYLLDDLGDDVVIGIRDIEGEDGGVWVISPRLRAEGLLANSVLEPGDFVQTFTTHFYVPRHEIDVWYRPSPSEPRAVPPKPNHQGSALSG